MGYCSSGFTFYSEKSSFCHFLNTLFLLRFFMVFGSRLTCNAFVLQVTFTFSEVCEVLIDKGFNPEKKKLLLFDFRSLCVKVTVNRCSVVYITNRLRLIENN